VDWSALLTFTLAFALAAASPGPGIAALVARALGSGLRPALPMIAGFVTGDIIYLASAAIGLAMIAAKFAAVFALIRYAGAAYLLYLAYRMWTATPQVADVKAETAASVGRMYLAGLSVTLGNPKVMVFYLALLPTIINLENISAAGFAELSAIVLVALSAVLTAYAALAARARLLFADATARRRLNRASGAIMAGAAVVIAVK